MDNHDAGKILVVEDEPSINVIFNRVLSCEGFKVDTIQTGNDARDVLEKNDYELIFLDIRMPGMSGKELYQWLEKQYPGKAARVVFSTGDVMSRDTQTFLDQTTRPYLAKPFTPSEIRTMVKDTLRKIKIADTGEA